MFTWVPFYEELASFILNYRTRQGELIGILKEMKGMNLPVISLEDKNAEGAILPLDEIDPFTFFATFNRGLKTENRIEILKVIQAKMQVKTSVPSDFEGIPVVNSLSARFFPPKKDRNLGDIETLWDLAEAAVLKDIQAMPGDLFQRCLEIKSIGLPKLTVGLFWLRPKKFMPFDQRSRNFFKHKGISIDVQDFDSYKNFLHKVQGEFSDDFPNLSHQAYEGDGPPNAIRYWQIAPGEQARLWDDLRSNSIMAVGWTPLNVDLKGTTKAELFDLYKQHYPEETATQIKIGGGMLWNFLNLKPGDRFVTNKGRSLLLGLGTIKGTYKFRPERKEYRHTIDVDYDKVSEAGIPIPIELKGKFGKTITPLTLEEFQILEKLFIPSIKKNYWIFQANPDNYDLEGALEVCEEITWVVAQHKNEIKKGDEVYVWLSGSNAGIYAIGAVLTYPGTFPDEPCEEPFIKKPEKYKKERPSVRLSIKRVLESPVSMAIILENPVLKNLKIITQPQGTNFPLTPEQAGVLEKLIGAPIEPQIWWVNQGTTLQSEMEGGFLWAPLKTKTGRLISHWKTMAEVSKDDIVVHYANGALRYVSKVLEPAVDTPKPEAIKEEGWPTEGQLVRVNYHELSPPIPLKKFADNIPQLIIHQGPLDSQGGVKQGYLFRFSPQALGIVQVSQPETAWPDFVPDYREGIKPSWPINPEYPLAEVAQETGFPEETLSRWIRSIERKGQAIVYGPPGTGKTFIAEKLALHLIGGGNGFQELVQFHPAYSYEDFVQGIRPQATAEGHLDYPVVPGRFRKFCDKAGARQGRCVLIIDEINRANLAQVFGELMYLLEYRNREVPLASGGTFQIPEKVRVIGTMNTADRSIALVDHALRRRFAFLPLYPDYEVLNKFHADTGFPVENLIQTLRQLNNQIGDPHYEVGITFFLRED
jgi:hypothetical protein